eukprot:jgi/Chrpa1/18153/Chrysochromulina_OHIO_Genome00024000-RA
MKNELMRVEAAAAQGSEKPTDLAKAADTLDGEAVRRKNVLESWATVLAKNDASWDVLQAEKRAGWESEAVDWRWRQRDATFGHGGSSKVDRVNNRGMVPSTRKYVVFYREWM